MWLVWGFFLWVVGVCFFFFFSLAFFMGYNVTLSFYLLGLDFYSNVLVDLAIWYHKLVWPEQMSPF